MSLYTVSNEAIYTQSNSCSVCAGFSALEWGWRKDRRLSHHLRHFGSAVRRTQSVVFVGDTAMLEMVEHLRTNCKLKHADVVIGIF